MGISHHFLDFNKRNFLNLVFGTEVVISVEIGLSIMRIERYDKSSNPIRLRTNLDLIKETETKSISI